MNIKNAIFSRKRDLDCRYDQDNSRISANMAIPMITLDGKYRVLGKVLVLPIKGNGDCHLELGKYT